MNMTNTGMVEVLGKLMRMIMEAMMMGTFKVTSGEISQVLSRKRGTRGSTHRGSIHQDSIHSKDGVRQRLLQLMHLP